MAQVWDCEAMKSTSVLGGYQCPSRMWWPSVPWGSLRGALKNSSRDSSHLSELRGQRVARWWGAHGHWDVCWSGIPGTAPAHFHLGVVLIVFGAETLMAEGLAFPHSFPVCQQGDLGLCASKQCAAAQQHLVVRGVFCPSCSQHFFFPQH